eukprot:CAMPEP_0197640966 /NCGR_PEP_ID=MMETSP1338-20131121/15073_1 /TAXON_ID=43686 ORGANISM="Pelagodinium beii, Strain RCC1491" /NCGR_SAMPLE_ID=MMETSP1338 /ASSEMBLY_ACC=CAM_ASM_000754 /LENGTH=567 /DNA_ID=CAMNT_0043213861 /DNA_START=103 /DNA_END=1806 /DNA_ORIENTATION=+
MANKLLDNLLHLDENSLAQIICEALQNKPSVAQAVVDFAVPELAYAPLKALSANRSKGVIESFDELAGHGVISSQFPSGTDGEMVPSDVILLGSQVNGLAVGTAVSFAVLVDENLQPHAFDLHPDDSNDGADGKEPGQTDLVSGVVSLINKSAGYTQVSCHESGHAVRVPFSVVQNSELAVNDIIAFRVTQVGSMLKADAPVWKKVGWDQDLSNLPSGENVGTISRVIPSGTGFIHCPALQELHGADCAVHASIMQECLLSVGDQVAFPVHVGSSGKMWMSSPAWKYCATVGRSVVTPFSLGTLSAPQVPLTNGNVQQVAPQFGKGANVNLQQGIQQMLAQFGKGANVNLQQVAPQFGKGANVNLQQVAPQFAKGGASSAGTLSDKQLCFGTVSKGLPSGDFRVQGWQPGAGEQHEVWVHNSIAQVFELSIDDLVAFRVHINKQGQPQASAPIWKMVGIIKEREHISFGEYIGQISRVLPNGLAFIDCADVKFAHGGDAAVHAAIMQECGLSVGDVVAFNLHVSDAGKIWMSAPCWKCCSAEKWNAQLEAFKMQMAGMEPPQKKVRM